MSIEGLDVSVCHDKFNAGQAAVETSAATGTPIPALEVPVPQNPAREVP